MGFLKVTFGACLPPTKMNNAEKTRTTTLTTKVILQDPNAENWNM
jgi:hypothetical protein